MHVCTASRSTVHYIVPHGWGRTTAWTLYSCCLNTVLVLLEHCTRAAWTLYSCCLNTVLVLLEHCTRGCTTLYAVRACCTACNTHAEYSREAMAEWVMFEADLWNGDSLSHAYFFQFGHCVNSRVQQDSFPVSVLSGKTIFTLQRHSKVSSSSARHCIHL